MLREVRLRCPAISCWVEFCYSKPTRLYIGEHTLWSCQGVQQGDPLGPLLFSLVLHPLICKIKDSFSPSLHAWYLDDGTIVGDTLVVGNVLEVIMEDGPGCGLHLNVDKTEVFWLKEDPRSRLVGIFPPNIARPLHGVKLLSGPASVDFEFCNELVMKRVAKTIGLMDAIAKINDPECKLLLLCSCSVLSLLRDQDLATSNGGWPPYLLHLGGLGVYSAGDVLNYAFLASRLQSVSLQTKLLRHTGIVSPGYIFDDALSVFNTSMETELLSNPSEIATPKLMKKMVDIYFTRVTKNAESIFSLFPQQMALWTSQMEDHTSDWLRTIPISRLGQTMNGPYIPTTVVVPAVPAIENTPAIPEHTTVETLQTMSPENKARYESKKEAIHLILTKIGDEIYSTVDACKTAQEMWKAIKRLQQEWSRFVTIVKQQHKLDDVSYHKLFDILKQYQKEVNELRAERIARNANPLALVATAQPNQDPYYQTPKSHKPYVPSSKISIPTRSHATTRNKGKEIAKPITPPSESPSEEDSDPEQAQRDKDMQLLQTPETRMRKDLSRAGPTSGIRAWREPLLKKLYFYFTMTSQNPSQTYPMPSPSVSSFTFPSTTEPVFSASTSEPVFESPNHTQPSQTTQSQQLQQYHTTTVLNNNAKFPYLKKEEYETRKRTGRDPKGNIMILLPVSVEEQIAVQRETKARTILLQSLPEDYMADFHHLDDARR
ncbi:putative reverse transcriptase domain-containing protein [Tanacetum coccineum]